MPISRAVTHPALREFLARFETLIASLSVAEKWDNVGFLLEASAAPPSIESIRVRTCIDLNPSVVEEAIKNKDNLIVTYHPQLFSPCQSLTLASHESLIRCAANGISVFSPHTALDSVQGGINDFLLDAFDSREVSRSACSIREDSVKVGRVSRLDKPMSLEHVIAVIKGLLGLSFVRVANPGKDFVSSIAVCAGSGASVVKGVDADLYWTGEMSHHEILDCVRRGKIVVLCEHSNTERPYLVELNRKLLAIGVESALSSSTDKEPLVVM